MNFILENLPQYAELSETDETVKIGYSHVRDTLRKFGPVEKFSIIKGTVQAKFKYHKDALKAHTTINGMMMGKNIVKTKTLYYGK